MDNRLALLTRSNLWAIKPEAVLLAIAKLTAQPFAGQWEAAKPSIQGKGPNKISVIPIQGVLTKDGPSWFGSSYDSISNALESAGSDSSVKRIVITVDSPGGDVTGLPETASLISQVAKVKPISAMVEGDSASAAYWLTSQAHDITVTPSGMVGSVGVRTMHVDMSKMLTDMGYKVTEIYSGDFKTEWSPYKPLSEEAQADMQTRLDATHQDFIKAVAGGRGARATADIVGARFGEGRMFGSAAAKAHGLVDNIQATRDFFRAIAPPQEEPAAGFPARSRLNVEGGRFQKV